MAVSSRGGQARRGVSAVGNGLLTLASIGGVACIVLVLLAVLFHITLIMFKTGSMSPTIPTGSLAVVREIPAEQIRVGDVVTVDRPGALPITHRVTSITPEGAGVASITLRGDANPTADPAPYLVSTVRLVVFSVPGLAYAVAAVSNPLALGLITVGAAAIVTWAFWPRDAAARGIRTARPAATRRRPTHARSGMRHAGAASAAILLLSAAAVLLPARAEAVGMPGGAHSGVTEQTISGTAITLLSIGDREAMQKMLPGVPVTWQIGITAHNPANDPGTVDISLVSSGPLVADPSGLWLTVDVCDVRWVGAACPGTATSIAAPGAASVILASPLSIGSMTTAQQRWVLVQAFLPSNPTTLPTGLGNLSIVASGVGTTVIAGASAGVVAYTGVDVRRPVQAAIGAITVGLALAFIAGLVRRRRGAA